MQTFMSAVNRRQICNFIKLQRRLSLLFLVFQQTQGEVMLGIETVQAFPRKRLTCYNEMVSININRVCSSNFYRIKPSYITSLLEQHQ